MARHDAVHEAFTELAPRYEAAMDLELSGFLGQGYAEFIDTLLEASVVESGGSILDIATGTALIPRRLADRVRGPARIVGLDITPAMLEQGQARLPTSDFPAVISLVCASGMQMPFPQGLFDLAICGFGTHHMEPSRLLSEIRRVLKVGGSLVLADVGLPAWWRAFWVGALLEGLIFAYRLVHRNARAQAEAEALANVRTAEEWHRLLVDSGFIKVDIAESRTRRRWYPRALTMRAVAGA
jgi:ubiquinone/menaquinone biosynthesis C-methylase UbiE